MKFVALGALLRILFQDYPIQTLIGIIIIGYIYYNYNNKNNLASFNSTSQGSSTNKIGMVVSGKDLKIGFIVKMKGDYWAEIVGLTKTTITLDDDGKIFQIPLRLEQKFLVN